MYRTITKPIPVPSGVVVTHNGNDFSMNFKGPKGQTAISIPEFVTVNCKGEFILVSTNKKTKKHVAIGATFRQLIANKVNGVAVGFKKTLVFEGIGYKALSDANGLILNLGFSHPIKHKLPKEVSASIVGSKIILESCEKDVLGQTASEIKKYRPPEPYKGKGIRYEGEQIKRKAGKTGKK